MRKQTVLPFMKYFYVIWFVILFCGIGGTEPIYAQGELSEKQAIKRASAFIEDRRYSLALEMLEVAIKNYPKSAPIHFLTGKSYFLIGQKNKAIAPIEFAYKNSPQVSSEYSLYYALALHFVMRFDEAMAILQKEKMRPDASVSELYIINDLYGQCKYGKECVAKPIPDVKIENLGPSINSPYPDFAPVVTADESRLFFTSRRPAPNQTLFDKRDALPYEDIYFSDKKNGEWTPARNIGPPINYEYNDACIALTPDGQTLYLLRSAGQHSDNDGDIFISKLLGEQWGVPENLGPPINSEYWEPSIAVNADGTFAIFVSNRPGGIGGRDLYYSYKKKDGKWSQAQNLGMNINTPGDEDSPFLHPDGQTLYFSSNGLRNMGGFDIFRATFLGDGTWTKPVPLGYPVNTTDDDIYFVISADGRHGYYASAGRPDGLGRHDIYRISFPEPQKQVEKNVPVPSHQPQTYVTILKGTVYDSLTRKPLQAALMVIDNEQNDTIATLYSNQSTGRYLITLPAGRNYGICAFKDGYLYYSDHVAIQDLNRYQEVEKDVPLLSLKVGSKFILRNIFFDFDKNTLRPASKAELERLYKLLKENPKMHVRIGGHTDEVGDDDYNQKLSENRSRAVVEYLVERGIAAGRLEYAGYGEKHPVDSNQTPQGRQNNRRTELEILAY